MTCLIKVAYCKNDGCLLSQLEYLVWCPLKTMKMTCNACWVSCLIANALMFHQTDCWRFFKTFSVPVVCLLEMSQIPTLAKKSWEGVYSIFLKGDRKLGQISSFFNWTIFMWVVWGVCVCVCVCVCVWRGVDELLLVELWLPFDKRRAHLWSSLGNSTITTRWLHDTWGNWGFFNVTRE